MDPIVIAGCAVIVLALLASAAWQVRESLGR
jgi:hypothetical protein